MRLLTNKLEHYFVSSLCVSLHQQSHCGSHVLSVPDTAKSAKEKLADVTNADVALNKANDLVQSK